MNEELKRAKIQRLHGLINAMKTMDAFAVCSLSPDVFSKYEDVKKELLEMYSDKLTEEDLESLSLEESYLSLKTKRDRRIGKLFN